MSLPPLLRAVKYIPKKTLKYWVVFSIKLNINSSLVSAFLVLILAVARLASNFSGLQLSSSIRWRHNNSINLKELLV